MTEDELTFIQGRTCELSLTWAMRVDALVAEVRRLEAEIYRVAKLSFPPDERRVRISQVSSDK